MLCLSLVSLVTGHVTMNQHLCSSAQPLETLRFSRNKIVSLGSNAISMSEVKCLTFDVLKLIKNSGCFFASQQFFFSILKYFVESGTIIFIQVWTSDEKTCSNWAQT